MLSVFVLSWFCPLSRFCPELSKKRCPLSVCPVEKGRNRAVRTFTVLVRRRLPWWLKIFHLWMRLYAVIFRFWKFNFSKCLRSSNGMAATRFLSFAHFYASIPSRARRRQINWDSGLLPSDLNIQSMNSISIRIMKWLINHCSRTFMNIHELFQVISIKNDILTKVQNFELQMDQKWAYFE